MPHHSLQGRGAASRRLSKSPPPSREDACITKWQCLPAVPSTLIIPLAARAHGSAYFPWLACEDADATRMLTRLQADVQGCLADQPTILNILWRTKVLKEAARAFFTMYPEAAGANLGCGLANHFQWLDGGSNTWVDADLPEVMALRQELLIQLSPRCSNACVDLGNPGWWHRLGLPYGAGASPVFVLCEGVLMYLPPTQVQAVLREFAQCAPPGSQWMCDVVSHLAVDRASKHCSVGPTGAEFLWGVRHMDELVEPHSRLRILQERSVSECYGWTAMAVEGLWRSWMGAPMYSMVMLGVNG